MSELRIPPKYPEIRIDYMLKGADREKTTEVLQAGYTYKQSLKKEEEGYVEIRDRDPITFISIGRKVLVALSYAEIGHEAELMQQGVEGIAEQLGAGEAIRNSRAGQQISGPLPDQE
jgi:hypothetical protein